MTKIKMKEKMMKILDKREEVLKNNKWLIILSNKN